MKVAVSLPNELYEEADHVASERGISRSELYARALRRYLAEEGTDSLTRQINDTCHEESDDLSAVARNDLVTTGLWEW
jgi:metal-responsive CopG/Arc/MetJ family transcriptional regulator